MTVTVMEVDHLLAVRERAESSYASACRTLVATPEDPHALNRVRWHAQGLRDAQAQYAQAVQAIGRAVVVATQPSEIHAEQGAVSM